MKYIIVALQFLTRIYIKKQNCLDSIDFGKSISFFPIIGLIIGLLTATPQFFLYINNNPAFSALLAIFLHYLIIGGLHADGFMDTCDGLFSNQNRQRKLEIMKDSCVGANAIIGFLFLVLLKWQSLAVLPPKIGALTLILIAILSKSSMVRSILKYPYAKKQGLGKIFVENAPKNAYKLMLFYTVCTLIIISPILHYFLIPNKSYFVLINFISYIILLTYIFNIMLNNYCVKKLGGLTGDTYGFVSECSELFLLLSSIVFWHIFL